MMALMMGEARGQVETRPEPPKVIAVDAKDWVETKAKLIALEEEIKRCQEARGRLKRAWHEHPLAIVALLGIPIIILAAKKH